MNIEKNKLQKEKNKTKDEIGSEFWLENIHSKDDVKRTEWITRFGPAVFTISGRGAIRLLLQQIKPGVKTVLLPAYVCESVILPFVEEGYKCFFYRLNKDLSINSDSLSSYKNIGVFLHMGYFGFQTNSNLKEILKHYKKESTIIVEDATHSLFSGYERYSENDFYVGSIRKWFGLPGGGFLATKKHVIEAPNYENKQFVQIRKEALTLKSKYMETNEVSLKEMYLKKFSDAEMLLDKDTGPYLMDNLSKKIMSTLDERELILKRRNNYLYLLDKLIDVDSVEVLFPFLDEDVCPLFFPIIINEQRSVFKKKLIEEKIYCPVHWPIPSQINVEGFENALKIYNFELSIPCDQRYGIEDMERIVKVIKSIKR